jgi:hypothetical protein
MRDTGVEFMYGPPLPNNLQALLKAGSRPVGTFRRHTRLLTPEALARALGRGRLASVVERFSWLLRAPLWSFEAVSAAMLRGLELTPVLDFGAEYEALALSMRAVATGVVCPVRDPAFLRWRYLVPDLPRLVPLELRRRGELVGFAALEVEGETAVIVDLFAPDQSVVPGALHLLALAARERGAAHVDFYGTAGMVARTQLRLLGYAGREERVFQVTMPPGDPQADTLYRPEAWHFTEGDKDSQTSFSEEPI